jgi:hypothetical protein
MLLTCSTLQAKIINFDNDPDLTQAIYYDLERNGGISKQADRELAEKFYLSYLKREDINSSQRARIYSQLGVLYTTASNLEKGEKADYKKAKSYFEKCLKIEPERIGYETLRARSMLPAVSNISGMERLKERVEFYEYLTTIDESQIRNNWLPIPEHKFEKEDDPVIEQMRAALMKDREAYFEKDVKRLLNLVRQLKYSHVYNATNCDARSMKIPEEGWAYILDHLIETDIVEREIVQKAMNRSIDPIINETLNLFINDKLPLEEIDDVVVSKRFIPSVSYAKEQKLPFVLDLQLGKTVKSQSYLIDDDEFQVELQAGGLAWNGHLCVFQGLSVVNSMQNRIKKLPLKRTSKYIAYKLPDKTSFPYGFVLSDDLNNCKWSIQIIDITSEGITILYHSKPMKSERK